MPSVKLVPLLLALTACGVTDDLLPSGTDERTSDAGGTTGFDVGQLAPDFTLPDTASGQSVSLYSALGSAKGAVLYFTMWCSTCDAHMTDLTDYVIPSFSDVSFFAIDYVSGSVSEARAAQVAAGWGASKFTVLADVDDAIEGDYDAPMGIVVISSTHEITLKGEYDRTKLTSALSALP